MPSNNCAAMVNAGSVLATQQQRLVEERTLCSCVNTNIACMPKRQQTLITYAEATFEEATFEETTFEET